MEIPVTRYVRSGEVHIAYQVVGSGNQDLIMIPGWVSNIEEFWNFPHIAAWLHRLSSFSRLILFDKRGTGLSDRVPEQSLPDLSVRIQDLAGVMQACKCRKAALLGVSEGVPMALRFAAEYPEKISRLILFGGFSRWIRTGDYPWGLTLEQHHQAIEQIRQHWGSAVSMDLMAPSLVHDERAKAHWASYLRRSASPGAAAHLYRMNMEIDVRQFLPHIQSPALIMHRKGDRLLLKEHSRYLHDHIAGSILLELEGEDHLPFFGETSAELLAIQSFFNGGQVRYNPATGQLKQEEITTLFMVKEYLDSRFAQPVTLKDLARRFAINEYKLKQGFKGLFGTPVIAYLSSVRLDAAGRLLRETALSVDEVSERVGYHHANNFSAAFKKAYSISPLAWRKQSMDKAKTP